MLNNSIPHPNMVPWQQVYFSTKPKDDLRAPLAQDAVMAAADAKAESSVTAVRPESGDQRGEDGCCRSRSASPTPPASRCAYLNSFPPGFVVLDSFAFFCWFSFASLLRSIIRIFYVMSFCAIIWIFHVMSFPSQDAPCNLVYARWLSAQVTV